MPNLKYAITKFKHTKLDGFKGLSDFITNLPSEVPKLAKEAVEYDGNNLLVEIMTGYENYREEHKDMKEIANDNEPHPTAYLLPVKDGVQATIYGSKRLLYYEFGTGPVGEGRFKPKGQSVSTYPSKAYLAKAGWQYGSGPNVIKAGTLKGADDYLSWEDMPLWYTSMEAKHPNLTHNYDMWMSPMGISFGIPAGAFYYNAVKAYVSELKDRGDFGKYSGTFKPGLRGLSYTIKQKALEQVKRK